MAEISTRLARTEPGASVVVISPHLDDAALSVGAAIAATAASGDRVIVLTVLAGHPSSVLAEERDASAGFATHADAVRARPPTTRARQTADPPGWVVMAEIEARHTRARARRPRLASNRPPVVSAALRLIRDLCSSPGLLAGAIRAIVADRPADARWPCSGAGTTARVRILGRP